MARLDDFQSRYQQFISGDVAGATDNWPDDFVWQGANDELPGGGRSEGRAAAMQALGETVGRLPGFRLEFEQALERDDTLVMIGRQHFDGPDGPVEHDVVHVWRYAGDTPKEIRVFGDTLSISRAVR